MQECRHIVLKIRSIPNLYTLNISASTASANLGTGEKISFIKHIFDKETLDSIQKEDIDKLIEDEVEECAR